MHDLRPSLPAEHSDRSYQEDVLPADRQANGGQSLPSYTQGDPLCFSSKRLPLATCMMNDEGLLMRI